MTSFGTELHYSDNSPTKRTPLFRCAGDPSPFTYFRPDTVHTPLLVSPPNTSLPSLSPALSLPQGYIHTSSSSSCSSIANLPFFLPAACDIKCSSRREKSSG